ncbi:phytoene/squalene synthase family protein [Notoacmeibacter ruber]|uniref:Phytoene/squalene synthase family protein n=1 Tax=Notoacmeibacter ruber TaxID=2670375 RepID=A0A3L7JHN4_9HYPH|nr:squalene/phytoene synthase family protein [Notoacmeibacter ruber]RLQ88002.1 phytoene/squalene synthase family protein [Notoacmeibacter ruber]
MAEFDPLSALRDADRTRYASLLYIAEDHRAALATLHLFDLELARIPGLIKEPMAGEIRLQWWREVLSGERQGEGRSHPLASQLMDVVAQYELPMSGFGMMLDGRISDLYSDRFETRTELEAYCGQTRSALFQLLLQIVDRQALTLSADASGHAGCAWGIGQILSSAAMDRGAGKIRIPDDLLQSAGGTAEDWLKAEDNAFLGRVVGAMVALGEEHLDKANRAIEQFKQEARQVYLPLAGARLLLRQADRMSAEVARTPLHLSPFRYHLALLQRRIRN